MTTLTVALYATAALIIVAMTFAMLAVREYRYRRQLNRRVKNLRR
jgi:hypothetical protein